MRLRFGKPGAVALGAVVGLSIYAAAANPGPRLVVEDSAADDLETVAVESWDRFLEVFSARTDCITDVRVAASETQVDHGRYDPATQTITIGVPIYESTAYNTLIHEYAHHLEHVCPAHRGFRSRFLIAQGLEPGRAWFGGTRWEEVPSEIYAEAVTQAALGTRQRSNTVGVTDAAVVAVRAWGAGES